MAVTGVFACGAECGVVSAGAAGGVLHWTTVNGTVTADTGTFHGTGLRSYKFTSVAGASIYLAKTLTGSPGTVVGRCYINFSSLPSAACRLIEGIPAAGNDPEIEYDGVSKLFAAVAGTRGATGIVVTTGVWYRLDFKFVVSGTTRTADLQVDGVAAGQSSQAGTASTFNSIRLGGNTFSTTANYTHFLDEIILSQTAGDYPIGAGQIIGLVPTGDGTHSFNAATDFLYNNTTNIPTTATDTYTYIDDVPLTGIADFLAINLASNVEYLEWTFADLGTDVSSVNGLEVVGAFHGASTTANKTTLRLNDGGTLSDVATDVDFSNTTISYHSKHYATAPSSGTWTKTKVDALRARGNSSYGTVDESPVPFIDGLMLEVDYIPTAPGTTSTDAGTLTDASALALTLTPSESAAIADLVTAESMALAATDAATLTEAATAQSGGAPNNAISSSDQATLAELLATTLAATPTDAATLGELAVSTLAATPTDAGTLTEARSATLGSTAADASAMAEAIKALLADVARSDSGLLTETSVASSASSFVISQSDAFTFADVLTVDLGLAAADLVTILGTVTGEQLLSQASELAVLIELAHAEAGPTFVAQVLGAVAFAPAIPGVAECAPAIPGFAAVED